MSLRLLQNMRGTMAQSRSTGKMTAAARTMSAIQSSQATRVQDSKAIMDALPQETSVLADSRLSIEEMVQESESQAEQINSAAQRARSSGSVGSDDPSGLAHAVAPLTKTMYVLPAPPAEHRRRLAKRASAYEPSLEPVKLVARISLPLLTKELVKYCPECRDYQHAIVCKIHWREEGKYGCSRIGETCNSCSWQLSRDDWHYGVCYG